MRNRDQSKSPGTFRSTVWFVVIAMIITNTLRTLLSVLVKTYDGIQESRHRRRT